MLRSHSSSSEHCSHVRFENPPVKKRTQTASSGHVEKSQPMIVQYPSFWEMSHWRSPFGLQSELTTHESPISLPQPVASASARSRYLMSGRILAASVTYGNPPPVACKVRL